MGVINIRTFIILTKTIVVVRTKPSHVCVCLPYEYKAPGYGRKRTFSRSFLVYSSY